MKPLSEAGRDRAEFGLGHADTEMLIFLLSKGASLKGLTHTFVSFHNARFIRRDSYNKPIESHTCDIERGSLADRSKQSKRLTQSPFIGHLQKWTGSCHS